MRRRLARRPESWLYAIAALAGLALLAPLVARDGAAAHAHHGHHHGRGAPSPDSASAGLAAWLAEWRHWILMVLAMMVPVAAPHARRVAQRSLWSRRHRAMTSFLGGYLTVWFAVGVVAAAVAAWFERADGWPAAALTLLAGAGWQVSPPRRRLLRRCGSLPPAVVSGWRADRDCAATGCRIGLRCAFVCAPVMLTMAVTHSLLLMAGLLAVLLSERARGPNPQQRAGRPLEAWCLGALAGVAALVAVV